MADKQNTSGYEVAYRNLLRRIQKYYDSALSAETSLNKSYVTAKQSVENNQEGVAHKVPGAQKRLEASKAAYNSHAETKRVQDYLLLAFELILQIAISETRKAHIPLDVMEWVEDVERP